MPQVFHPSTNTFSKVSIFGSIFFLIALGWISISLYRSPFFTRVGNPIDQPVAFSHEHHVRGLGIDCRYCHVSVERSSFADVPPTETCMTCHSQIWVNSPALEPVRQSFRTGQPIQWNRVNNLADHVYFNHSIHIAKGIGCVTCHGQVDQMPLTWKSETLYMEWCLQCHRHPENYIRPREKVFDMQWQAEEDQKILGQKLVQEYKIMPASQLDDCSICHR